MRTTILAVLVVMSTLCTSCMAQEGTAEELLIIAQELYENGSYERAAEVYDRVIQMDPSNADAWFGKGNAVKVLYKDPEDTNLYEYIGRDPQYADAWAVRGDVFATTARIDEAASAYEKALQLYDERLKEDPSDIDAWLNKGRALDMLDVIYYLLNGTEHSSEGLKDAKTLEEEALQAYDKAIDIDPSNSEVWAAKGRSLSGYEALEAYDKAIELDPKNEDAWLGRANNYVFLAYDLNDTSFYNKAIEAIDKALNINPKDSRIWSTKGQLLLSQGKYEEATKSYDTAIGLTPQDKLWWFAENILYTYDNVLRSDADRYTFIAAQENASTDDETVKSSETFSILSTGESVQPYDDALQTDSGNYSIWITEAQSLTSMGMYNESIEAYQNALELIDDALKKDPQNAEVWKMQGNILVYLGKQDESIKSYESAIEIFEKRIEDNPNDAESWWLKAECLDILNNKEGAIQAYDKVIELNSTYAVGAWIRKADIFGCSSKYDESRQAFDRATELMPNNAGRQMGSVWKEDNASIAIDLWGDKDNVLRVSLGRYNESTNAYDRYLQMNSRPVYNWSLARPFKLLPAQTVTA